MDRDERPYDIVLLGATGFAGRLTAEYLARTAPASVRWAIAGRTHAKLDAVRQNLAAIDPALAELPLLTADVEDPASVRTVVEQARALVTTVGPYALYGDAVVAACAAAGTDYLDLTGEPEFVDTTYARHHRTAQASGARLIHSAGFDSIPHDLGAFFTVLQLPEDVPLRVAGYVRASAAISGGTLYSALTAFGRLRQNLTAARARRAAEGPNTSSRSVHARAGRPGRDPINGGWALPFPSLDPQVVSRSARALERYGPSFDYTHHISVAHLPSAVALPLGMTALVGAAQIPPVRRALSNRLAPGDGPSQDKRSASWFTVSFVGEGGGTHVVTRVSGGDPGYDETAKMLGESALCLALDDLPVTSGQVTPVTAMGQALITRLNAAGITFEVLR